MTEKAKAHWRKYKAMIDDARTKMENSTAGSSGISCYSAGLVISTFWKVTPEVFPQKLNSYFFSLFPTYDTLRSIWF